MPKYTKYCKNQIEQWVQMHYEEDLYPKQLTLLWKDQYNPYDYGNLNNSVLCELKTLRTSTLFSYSYIDLLTRFEYKAFTDALNKNPDTLCFVFVYFSQDNTLFWTRITIDTNLEQIVNKYGKQCYKINKDDFKEIRLYKNYQLYLA